MAGGVGVKGDFSLYIVLYLEIVWMYYYTKSKNKQKEEKKKLKKKNKKNWKKCQRRISLSNRKTLWNYNNFKSKIVLQD